MANKMIKRDMYEWAIQALESMEQSAERDATVEMFHKEISALERKSSKPSKASVENEKLRAELVSLLATVDAPICIENLKSLSPTFEGFSNQKMSGLLAPLAKDGTIVRSKVGKLTAYSLAE